MVQILTWTGSGYGSGTSRTLYLNGAPYGTAQVPKEYAGREETYFRSQYNPQGIVTREQAGEPAYEQGLAQTRVQQLAERARHEAYAQEQQSLKSAFVPSGREPPRSVIGIEQAKQSEKAYIESGKGTIQPLQTLPNPGEYGYHATPTRPGGISTEFAPTPTSQYFKIPVNQIGIRPPIGQYGAQPGSPAYNQLSQFEQQKNQLYTGKIAGQLIKYSDRLQSKFASSIGYNQDASPVTKFVYGAGSVVTGLPAFAGMSIASSEIITRKPSVIPKIATKGLPMFASQTYTQATKEPYEFAGSLIGMYGVSRAGVTVLKLPAKLPGAITSSFKAVGRIPVMDRPTGFELLSPTYSRILYNLPKSKDPWAKIPTMRQSAEIKGTDMKRTKVEFGKTFKEPSGSGVVIKSGRQSLIAIQEQPSLVTPITAVQKTKTVQQYKQVSGLSKTLQQYGYGKRKGPRQQVELSEAQIDYEYMTESQIASILQKQKTSQIQIQRYAPFSIQKLQQVQKQKSLQILKQEQKQISPQIQSTKPVQKLKQFPVVISMQKHEQKARQALVSPQIYKQTQIVKQIPIVAQFERQLTKQKSIQALSTVFKQVQKYVTMPILDTKQVNKQVQISAQKSKQMSRQATRPITRTITEQVTKQKPLKHLIPRIDRSSSIMRRMIKPSKKASSKYFFRFTKSKTIDQLKKGLISDITKKKRKKTTSKRTTKKKSKR